MTQRERIHSMLKAAGSSGIRSDEFFNAYMPRAAARIQELRDSGVEITSEREGKFVRYTLQNTEGQLFQLPSMNAFTDSEAA